MITGLAYILVGGTFSGIFAIPFKKNTGWKWENNWFIWSFVALLIAPWVVAAATVPDLYAAITSDMFCLLLVAVFGLIWGYGAILFGKGIDALGVSLGQPIMLGLINSVGTLMPIVIKDPALLMTPAGIKTVCGVLIIMVGIVFYSIAGGLKMKEKSNQVAVANGVAFKKGLVICVLAGIFGPMVNFAFVFGEPMQHFAIQAGASAVNAANPIWCIVLSAGFIINVIACILSFRKNNTWRIYRGNMMGVAFAALGGLMWYLSIMFYGMGGNVIGEQGASIGWATMQSTAIIAGCIAGVIAGEWKGCSRKSMSAMLLGLLLLVIGVVTIAF